MTDPTQESGPESPEEGPEATAHWPREPWRLYAALGWLGVALVVFSLGFFPLRASHDEWWHLKTGKWIVDHGLRLPRKDVFTYTAASYDWDNHEWLTQVAMYVLWRWGEERVLGGWRTVILVKALVLTCAYLLLARLMAQRAGGGARGAAVAIFLALLAAAVGKRMFWPRPPVVSSLFLVFFLYVMWLHRTGRLRTPYLFVLPLLMPLWANLHGGFILGGAVVAAYCAGEALEWAGGRWIARRDAQTLRPAALRVGIYLGLGVLCGLASLLNPFGYKVYLLTGRVMGTEFLAGLISELEPPDFRFTWAFNFLLAFLSAGFGALAGRSLAGRARKGLLAGLLALVVLSACLALLHVSALSRSQMPSQEVPYFQYSWSYSLLWLSICAWLGALLAGAAPSPGAPRWPPAADLLLVAFFLSQSVQHVRHLILFGLVGAPVAAWMLGRLWDSGPDAARRGLRWGLAPLSVAMGLWLVFLPGEGIYALQGRKGLSQFDRNRQLLRGMEAGPREYPIRAVNFILAARLPGRMFNRNNCSGYLIWKLSPEHYRLFTDSRFDIFGEDFLADEMGIVVGRTSEDVKRYYEENPNLPEGIRDWHEIVRYWRINWLFVDQGETINRILAEEAAGDATTGPPASGWALVYLDYRYRIWLKRTEENRPWIEKYEIRDPFLLDLVRNPRAGEERS